VCTLKTLEKVTCWWRIFSTDCPFYYREAAKKVGHGKTGSAPDLRSKRHLRVAENGARENRMSRRTGRTFTRARRTQEWESCWTADKAQRIDWELAWTKVPGDQEVVSEKVKTGTSTKHFKKEVDILH